MLYTSLKSENQIENTDKGTSKLLCLFYSFEVELKMENYELTLYIKCCC